MKKRILSLLLAFVMIIGMIPTNSFTVYATELTETEQAATTESEETTPPTTEAPVEEEKTPPSTEAPKEETTSVNVKTTVVQDTAVLAANTYDVYVGGVGMANGTYLANNATTTQTTKPSGGYAYFKDDTLILNDYEYEGKGYMWDYGGYYACIYGPTSLNIVLNGSSRIAQTDGDICDCIYSLGDVVVSGTGSLTLTDGYSGIYTESNVTIDGGTITVQDVSVGIFTHDYVTVNGGAIHVTSEEYSLIGSTGITINGGELTLVSTNTVKDSTYYAMYSDSITIADGLEVQASTDPDGTLVDYVAADNNTYDRVEIKLPPEVYVGGVGMRDGDYLANNATATRPDKPSVGYAYYENGVLTLHNYNFSGTGYEIGNDSQTLIYASRALRIVLEGENILTQTTENNLGIYFAEGGTISGSGSLAISGPCTYGIHVETGDFTCYADYVSVLDCAHGVNVKTGDIWISGGLLDVKVQRNAVAARQGSVTVTDGELIAKSTNGSDSNRAINAANGFSVANHLTVLAAEAYDGVPGAYDAANIKNYDLIMVKNYPILLGVKTTDGSVGESEEGGSIYFEDCTGVYNKTCSAMTYWHATSLRTASGELNSMPVAGETYYFDITIQGEGINFSGVSAMHCDVTLPFYDVAFDKFTYTETSATITFSATRRLTYDVLFYFRGDEYPISGRTIEAGQLVTKPEDPGKEGVHFLGWYTEDGELYDFDAPVTENINLYAVFGHYVSFHVGETTSTQFVADGKTMTEPIPSKEGYAFRGWYTADNKYYDFTTPVTGDLELYAKLVKLHTVTITVRESTSTQIVEDGKTAIKPGISGNGFIGWYTADDQPYDFSTPVTGDLEIYAKFAEYHTVNIYVDGSISTQLVENGKPATEPAVPSKEGYAFTGWYTADNQSYGFGAPITSDLDIYARFVKLHTVTFYVGETTSTQVITDGETVTPPEDPAQEGLVFTGWYTEDGKLYDFTNPVTQDLKLVAYLAGVMVDGVGLLDGDYLPNGSNTTTTTKPSDGYVYYKDGVLTLHNYDYTGAGYKVETEHSAAIYSERNLTIVLDVGTVNKLEATGHYGIYVNNCIDTSAMLTIQGSGTLEIDAAGDGVHVYGDLNFINTELKIVAVNNALYAHGTVTAENTNATINATSNYALYSTKDIVIEDGTWNLSAEALNCIWAENNVSIIDVEVTAECDNVGIGADGLITIGKGSLNINAGSYGVYAKGTVAVSQGSLNITAENRSGVYTTEDIEIESAILDITSGENGLYSDNGNVIVTDCDITIESQGYAISAETGKMLIENTNATLNSDHGIDANDIELKGTTTTMVEINSTKNFGIYSHTDITIESGTWTINSPKQTGILANDSVSISNAIVTVVADRQGIYASDNISIDGCTMDVRSTNTENDNNFCALNGNVIFGSNVSVLASTESDGALYIYKDELLDTYDKIVVGPYCNHSFDSGVVTTEPSCGTKGVKTYTCGECEAKYIEEVAATGDHDYDNGVVTTEPSCETEGVKTYTCQNGCGITKTEAIEALEHTWDEGEIIHPATVDKEGEKRYTCLVCGSIRTETIPKLVLLSKAISYDGNGALSGEHETEYILETYTYTLPECNFTPQPGQIFRCWRVKGVDMQPGESFVVETDTVITAIWRDMTVFVGGVEMDDGYYLANGSSTPTTTKPSGGYAFYDDGKLVLNNYTYTGFGVQFSGIHHAVIFSAKTLDIELIGTNTLTLNQDDDHLPIGIVLRDDNSTMEIRGEGALSITGGGTAIEARQGGIITVHSGTITTDCDGTGIKSDLTDFVMNGGNVTLVSKQATGMMAGSITVNGGTLDVTGAPYGQGIASQNGDITINGGKVIVRCNDGDGNDDENYALRVASSGKLVIDDKMNVQASTQYDGTLGDFVEADYKTYDRVVIEEAIIRTVTFMVDSTVYKTEKVKDKTLVAQPADPELDGWKFLGWYTDDDEPFNFDLYIEADTVIYAKFEDVPATYTVYFFWNKDDEYTDIWREVEAGQTAAPPEDFAPEGFLGWYTEDDELFDFSTPIKSDLNLYAKFEDISSANGTVSGTVTSFNSNTDTVTIQLIEEGHTEVAYEVTTTGNSATYSITDVVAGTYTMKVSKNNHVTREYTVTVGSTAVTQNAKIHLLGDVNGDGKVTTIDFGRANAHAKGTSTLTGYELLCADTVKQDGLVTTADAARINAHARGTSTLW